MAKKTRVIVIMIIGYLIPPIAWNLMMLVFNIVPKSVFLEVLKNPIQPIYALPVIVFFSIFFRKQITSVKNIQRVPKLYLLSLMIFCLIGPNTGMIGISNITKTQAILGNLLSIPLVFLFCVPILLLVIKSLEKYISSINEIKTKILVSLKTKLYVSNLFTIFGSIFLIIAINSALFFNSDNVTLNKFITFNVESFIIIFLIAFINTLFVISSIKTPVFQIINKLKEVFKKKDGKDITDLTNFIEVEAKDEIGEMANYFNITFEQIKMLVTLVKVHSSTLKNSGEDLASNMTETAAAINEISANIQSIKNQIMNQSASVTETSATMEEITKGVKNLNELIEDQSSNVTESSSIIEEMMASIVNVTKTLEINAENIDKLSKSSKLGRINLNKIAKDIKTVAKDSQGLIDISKVIQNIASQTNLLAMNAAIEAAHAGESGKGFAVVAEEVRKLAESSSEQSKIVTDILNNIKLSIDNITNSTEDVIDQFNIIQTEIKVVRDQEISIRTAMKEQSVGSKQVLDSTGHLNEITQKVKSSSSEMYAGIKQVQKETNSLNSITQEISSGMNEIVNGVEQLTIAANQVNKLSEDNKLSIDELINEVDKFEVD